MRFKSELYFCSCNYSGPTQRVAFRSSDVLPPVHHSPVCDWLAVDVSCSIALLSWEQCGLDHISVCWEARGRSLVNGGCCVCLVSWSTGMIFQSNTNTLASVLDLVRPLVLNFCLSFYFIYRLTTSTMSHMQISSVLKAVQVNPVGWMIGVWLLSDSCDPSWGRSVCASVLLSYLHVKKSLCSDFISHPFKFHPRDVRNGARWHILISNQLPGISTPCPQEQQRTESWQSCAPGRHFPLDPVGHTHDFHDIRLSSQACVHRPQGAFVSDGNNTGLYNERDHVLLYDRCCSL